MSHESKTPITIKIPTSLYNALVKAVSQGKYPSQTAGVIISLEHDLDESAITNEELQKTIQKQYSTLDEKDKTIQKLALDFSTFQATCAGLERLLNEKDTRILDLQKQNEQLGVKDGQIEKLNENMHKQAVHIQTLIQEISQLNVKLLPENTKKPWYRFW
jgi:predicted RNase H-like nuclease (RuvC/YqgF family)